MNGGSIRLGLAAAGCFVVRLHQNPDDLIAAFGNEAKARGIPVFELKML
jgi:hypothetical protein